MQAMESARLVFTAWDGSEGKPYENLARNLPYCCQVYRRNAFTIDMLYGWGALRKLCRQNKSQDFNSYVEKCYTNNNESH